MSDKTTGSRLGTPQITQQPVTVDGRRGAGQAASLQSILNAGGHLGNPSAGGSKGPAPAQATPQPKSAAPSNPKVSK